MNSSTIYSLATASGRGAIAIIRISGDMALSALKTLFSGEIEDHKLCYGTLSYKGRDIDNIMAVYMKAPRTYTREDVVELHLHGGMAAVTGAMEALSSLGLRQAEPGEFTKRAFLNGRIDLTRAEAVMSMISADSAMSGQVALEQMKGASNDFVMSHRDTVLDILAALDVTIDYPDEDIEEETYEEVKTKLQDLITSLKQGISTRLAGQILEEGYKIALIGRPNVGKSSLLNAVLGKDRVIVTAIAGTTRDMLKESYLYKGQLFTFLDTAGIRESDDVIEKIGIKQSLSAIDNANLVLVVLDGSMDLTDEDKRILELTADKHRIIVVNKCDIKDSHSIEDGVTVSAKEMENIDVLLERIHKEMSEDMSGLGVLTGSRHIGLANRAVAAFENAISAIESGDDIECIEIHIRDGWHCLCEITGEYFDEDIINRIFEKFCLGK